MAYLLSPCNKQVLKQIKKMREEFFCFPDSQLTFDRISLTNQKKQAKIFFSSTSQRQAGSSFLFSSTKTSEEKTKTLLWKPESSVKEFNAQISITNLKNHTLWKTTAPSKTQIWCSPALLHPNSFHISHALHFENATGMSPN